MIRSYCKSVKMSGGMRKKTGMIELKVLRAAHMLKNPCTTCCKLLQLRRTTNITNPLADPHTTVMKAPSKHLTTD
jgi:hypothetical protein